jgi:pSer/pThr/pTyr-binding forkhead associated (FHA) protein
MAVLIVTEGPAKEQRFALAGSRLAMVGRDAGCSFQIVDPELSRYHLQIRYAEDQDRHFAIDFQSKNGVFVNGAKIETETPLQDGDVIAIGGTKIVYAHDDSPDAQRPYETWKKLGQGHVRTLSDWVPPA